MEFFGITLYGPQNYIKDLKCPEYKEPRKKEDVPALMEQIKKCSTLPETIERPDIETIRVIDTYLGRANGFAYGSIERFKKMRKKGVIKPMFPCDMYRNPPTTHMEYGWWLHDPVLSGATWQQTVPRHPQPSSPNTLILDKVRKNNKYATLF